MMKRFLGVAAAVVGLALAVPAMAVDFGAVLGGGTTAASSGSGVAARSGVVGGSAVLGITAINTGTVSAANGSVLSTNLTTAVPLANQSSVVQSHNAGSVTTLNSASLGLAGNLGGSGGSAGSSGGGTANGGYLGLGISLLP